MRPHRLRTCDQPALTARAVAPPELGAPDQSKRPLPVSPFPVPAAKGLACSHSSTFEALGRAA
jgi:hypothetical protein